MKEFTPLYRLLRSCGSAQSPVVLFAGNELLLRKTDHPAGLLPLQSELPAALVGEAAVLGYADALPVLGLQIRSEEAEAACPAGFAFTPLRSSLARLTVAEQRAVMRGKPLLNWLAVRRYCGVCGTELADSETEEARICRHCAAAYFPKISPAVIVLVKRGPEEILLAHNRKFKGAMFGLIAGFVEAGESVEEAVHREIAEEVGIRVKDLHYAGSQSWPFPDSLMLGFFAEYAGGELRPDGEEITEAGFYRRDALPEIPGPGSIARRLLDAWFTGKNSI